MGKRIFQPHDVAIVTELLQNDTSIPRIAELYKCSDAAVSKFLNRNGIPRRRQTLKSKEELERLYVTELKSMNEIAKLLGVTYQAVDYYLNKFSIPKRDIKEIQKVAQERYRGDHYEYLPTKKHKSRGYCFRHNDLWFASMAELTFYVTLLSQKKEFKFQPFTFNRKRPDFLSGNTVYEIKYGLKDKDKEAYIKWSLELKKELDYEYVIVDYKDKTILPTYKKISEAVKSKHKLRRNKTTNLSDATVEELISLL